MFGALAKTNKWSSKKIGNLLTVVSIVLIVTGLLVFFNGPTKSGISEELYVNTNHLTIEPANFGNVSYVDKLYSAPTLVINRTATALVSVNVAQEVQAYLVNATEYKQFNNTQVTAENIAVYSIGTNNYNFTPDWNTTYHVFLRNLSNRTVNCDLVINGGF